jgi:hypothetical protein
MSALLASQFRTLEKGELHPPTGDTADYHCPEAVNR